MYSSLDYRCQGCLESKTYSRQTIRIIMTRPTTEALKTELEELVKKHNNALEVQQNAKQRVIEIQAILQDRAYGDTDDNNSTGSTN